MPLHTWWTFVVACFFVSGSPGPNMLYMLSSGMRHGVRQTFFTMAGCMLAVFSVTAVSAAGVGTLLAASPRLFDGLCLLGACYLIYLGVRTACQPAISPIDQQAPMNIPESATPRQHFRGGMTVALSNPKLFLFATAFFPQFIDKARPELVQFSILFATFFCIEMSWYTVYASGGSRLATYLRQEKTRRVLNRAIGALFALFGLLLLVHRTA